MILIGAAVTVLWDTWLQQQVGKIKARRARRRASENVGATEANSVGSVPLQVQSHERPVEGLHQRNQATSSMELRTNDRTGIAAGSPAPRSNHSWVEAEVPTRTDTTTHGISLKYGIGIIAAFLGWYEVLSLRTMLSNNSLFHPYHDPTRYSEGSNACI